MSKETFEQFLMEKHAEDYYGLKDCMIDDFSDWVATVSSDELIEYGDEFAKKYKIDIGLDKDKTMQLVILNTLETKINTPENKAFVFVCCGNPGKKIEVRGQCPWCNKENTEVVNLWKYKLTQAIVSNLKDIVN